PSIHAGFVKTPLIYTFGRRVGSISADSLADEAYVTGLSSSCDRLYLLSLAATPPPGFTLVDSLRFSVMTFRLTPYPPTTIEPLDAYRLYLYTLGRKELLPGSSVSFGSGIDPVAIDWLESGWSNPESWGVWGVGHSAKLRIPVQALSKDATISGLRL